MRHFQHPSHSSLNITPEPPLPHFLSSSLSHFMLVSLPLSLSTSQSLPLFNISHWISIRWQRALPSNHSSHLHPSHTPSLLPFTFFIPFDLFVVVRNFPSKAWAIFLQNRKGGQSSCSHEFERIGFHQILPTSSCHMKRARDQGLVFWSTSKPRRLLPLWRALLKSTSHSSTISPPLLNRPQAKKPQDHKLCHKGYHEAHHQLKKPNH